MEKKKKEEGGIGEEFKEFMCKIGRIKPFVISYPPGGKSEVSPCWLDFLNQSLFILHMESCAQTVYQAAKWWPGKMSLFRNKVEKCCLWAASHRIVGPDDISHLEVGQYPIKEIKAGWNGCSFPLLGFSLDFMELTHKHAGCMHSHACRTM